jgi:hypothetical protein
MNPDQNKSQVPIKRETLPAEITRGSELPAAAGFLPPSGTVDAGQKISIAQAEGYDPQAIELGLEPSGTTLGDKMRLIFLTAAAAALVSFFFPTERFFKPKTKDLGTMTIGGPVTESNLAQQADRNEPWFKVLLQIDRLYFAEGKSTQAIRTAESALATVPKKNWEKWKNVFYRYWELLWAAGRVQPLKTATRAYLQILPEDPFANYYHARAFFAATNRLRSFTPQMKRFYRREAEAVIQQIDNACNSLNAQSIHPEAKEKEDVLRQLYRKLRLQQAELYGLIWKLGGYREDQDPDVVYRDKALDICDSPEFSDMKEAKALKINIYTNILDRWYWFEGQEVIQGMPTQRKKLEQEIKVLQKELKEATTS